MLPYSLSNKLSCERCGLVRRWIPGDKELEEALDRGYAEGGYPAAMLRYAETLAARPEAPEFLSLVVVIAFAYAGEIERTLDWLEIMYETGNPNMPAICEPSFGIVFDEPRFRELLRKMKLPELGGTTLPPDPARR